MGILLDTCAVLWSGLETGKLSPKAKQALQAGDERIAVNAVSAAEIACLQIRNRLVLPSHWKTWFRSAIDHNGWTVLPIELAIIEEAYSLPGEFHDDPVDRILVATARLKDLTLITSDQKILAYPHVKTLW